MKIKVPTSLVYVLPVVLALALFVWFAFRGPYQFHGTVIEPPLPVADFSLQSGNQKTFHLSDAEGKLVLLFFGYTRCPDVCPVTLGTFKQVHESLGDDAENIKFLMITADPERDHPDDVGAYVARFNPDFVGLSGDPSDLESVRKQLGVYVEKEESDSAAGYLVSHTSSVFVLDRNGSLILTFPYGTTAADMTEDIEQLLKQSQQR